MDELERIDAEIRDDLIAYSFDIFHYLFLFMYNDYWPSDVIELRTQKQNAYVT